jgi:hypothetical protein
MCGRFHPLILGKTTGSLTMTVNHDSDTRHVPGQVEKSMHDHSTIFFVEGVALILLGLLAIIVPSFASANVTVVLGWLFLVSGAIGLVVPGIGFARNYSRRCVDRAQIAGFVRRSDGLAF